MSTITRTAEANWKSGIEDGHGLVTTESRSLVESRYSLPCRIDDGQREETNPEELIAAAAASCFSMALSKTLTDQNAPPTKLVTRAHVEMEAGDSGINVRGLRLESEGIVPGFNQEQFEQAVADTQRSCPIYKLLEPGFKTVSVKAELMPA